jgi:RNA polymerase I specific initiation factor
MPLFALPFDTSSTPSSVRSHLIVRSSHKRRRLSSGDDTDGGGSPSGTLQPSSLSIAATNPLSLTPDEVKQYRTAGLELDQELPSKTIADFPHRGFPPFYDFSSQHKRDQDNGGGDDNANAGIQKSENRYGERRGPHLRMQHLAVLTAILHRYLLEGDIPRASRAWALLLRTQVNGKGIDIRTSGYWGIGAELLIRSGERPARGRRLQEDGDAESDVPGSGTGDSGDITDEEAAVGGEVEDDGDGQVAEQRWGTAAGLERAKEYYERLILQHPYKQQFHKSVNALDFWPAMLSCEIYGVQFEQKEALRQLDAEEDNSDDSMVVDNYADERFSDYDNSSGEDATNPDRYFTSQQRKEARQQARKLESVWQQRNTIRQTTLAAAQAIAARMDELMTSPPYSDSYPLLRLRGMLALYIGDLSVPDVPPEEGESGATAGKEEQELDNLQDEGVWAARVSYRRISERRFVRRQRKAEHERGLQERRREMATAKEAFEKARKKAGVKVDSELARLCTTLGTEGEDGGSEWSERGMG